MQNQAYYVHTPDATLARQNDTADEPLLRE